MPALADRGEAVCGAGREAAGYCDGPAWGPAHGALDTETAEILEGIRELV